MCLVVRLMAAVYVRKDLPAEVTTPKEAEAWARAFARQHRFRVCLVVSRRISVWIDAQGQVEARTEATLGHPNLPFMQLKGRRFLLGGMNGRPRLHNPVLLHDRPRPGGERFVAAKLRRVSSPPSFKLAPSATRLRAPSGAG